ncbi:cytochrome c biogenesis CcdA family protein [Streptomyces sp. MS19]|uniref:cytochrome c biogenesis CcdA family protein n=1 Tax=Streptomyces sp. MS19 TaxID=3385972 RepID=UPI0039A25CA1
MGQNETILTGALLLAIPVAVFGGLVSFFSPCVLPLVPGYLSYVTGVGGADLGTARRGRMLAGASLFVLGFTAVYVSSGALFGEFSRNLLRHQTGLQQIFGALTIVLGIVFMGVVPRLGQREFRLHRRPSIGLAGAPMLGVVFGIGWTPCIGPTLSSVQFLALQQGTAERGALLTFAYCVGLGLPFILTALAFRRALGAFAWVKKHYVWVMRIGGGMLIVTGLLLVTGAWNDVTSELRYWTSNFTTGV